MTDFGCSSLLRRDTSHRGNARDTADDFPSMWPWNRTTDASQAAPTPEELSKALGEQEKLLREVYGALDQLSRRYQKPNLNSSDRVDIIFVRDEVEDISIRLRSMAAQFDIRTRSGQTPDASHPKAS